jgi:hypothetical protein
MKLYVVKMNRWGDSENHSYIEGVYDTEQQAIAMGNHERMWRAGKYEPEILTFPLNEPRNKPTCIDCGTPTNFGAGSARCSDCWDDKAGPGE